MVYIELIGDDKDGKPIYREWDDKILCEIDCYRNEID
jgi:hypothetical protein